ncbi:hypothetical protein EAO15_01285, partial [Klebsiella pneumoniae]
ESHKLEKLCRYITRPAISEQRLSISPQGRVRYQLKTPWRCACRMGCGGLHRQAGGTGPAATHLTRFHGVFAPNANLRAADALGARQAACGRCGSGRQRPRRAAQPRAKRRAMSWAQRLKRVFSIDITTCAHCGGAVRIVASIRPQYSRHPRPLRETRRAGASTTGPQRAAPRMRRRPTQQPSQSPIRCGHDPAGLRSALCRDSVRNGYALSRCVAPRCRKPTHEPPIPDLCPAALARPLPTRQTRQKGG